MHVCTVALIVGAVLDVIPIAHECCNMMNTANMATANHFSPVVYCTCTLLPDLIVIRGLCKEPQ